LLLLLLLLLLPLLDLHRHAWRCRARHAAA
jgi:hypothetical protein